MEENYIVSARKYRPSTFSSVVGQKALTATLRNAIATNHLAHAYLFCGSRGVGKTSCARIFAKTINCQNPTPQGDPCNECASCRAFNENRSLNIIELDAASNNSVDDIRSLVDQVQIPPTDGRYRVVIVDEVHMLSTQAFNAFLKTLEEPPAYVIFILATTEKHKIIPTILSRCQIYDFNRITIADMIDHLEYVAAQEGFTAERQALNVIARKADGAMRDALSIFDQVAASSRGNITYQSAIDNLNVLDSRYYSRLVEAFVAGNVPDALLIYKEVRDRGFDSLFFLNGLAGYLRDLMVAREPRTLGLLDTDDDERALMARQGAMLPPEFYYAAMSLCNEADMAYRTASSKTFLIELLLIRLCQQSGPSPISDGAGEGRKLRPVSGAAPTITSTPQPAPTPVGSRPAATATAPPQPAPQSAPQPTPAPVGSRPAATANPQPAPARQRRTPLRAGGKHISLSSALDDKPEAIQAEVQAATAPRRTTPFVDEALVSLWEEFAAARPTAHLLVNTMRQSAPRRRTEGECLFDVTVENQAQVDVMNETAPELLAFLRDRLNNDHITLEFHINQGASMPSAWNDRELLAHIVDRHPYAARFIADFKLTL